MAKLTASTCCERHNAIARQTIGILNETRTFALTICRTTRFEVGERIEDFLILILPPPPLLIPLGAGRFFARAIAGFVRRGDGGGAALRPFRV